MNKLSSANPYHINQGLYLQWGIDNFLPPVKSLIIFYLCLHTALHILEVKGFGS